MLATKMDNMVESIRNIPQHIGNRVIGENQDFNDFKNKFGDPFVTKIIKIIGLLNSKPIDLNNKNIDFIKKVLIRYQNKFPDLFGHINISIIDSENINIVMDSLLENLYKEISVYANYQGILNNETNTEFSEGLLRVKSTNTNFNHVDFLELHENLGKTINVFYLITENIFKDISIGKIQGPVSINAEVSDILDENFIRILRDLSSNYLINFKKHSIIIETLENQKIPRSVEFRKKIKELNELGIKVALDDIGISIDELDYTIESIDYLGGIEIVKIDGKSIIGGYSNGNKIKGIYDLYKEDNERFYKCFKEIKPKIDLLNKKGVKVIAEWVKDLDIYYFVKDILGINLYQGFYSNDEKNIESIRISLNK